MRKWSKLQKELYLIMVPDIGFQIHCSAYRMKSQRGHSALPRYWITLQKEIIFDYPRQFVGSDGSVKNNNPKSDPQFYPYICDVSAISNFIREYIDTPVSELMSHHFEDDYWGLADVFRAADRRIGHSRLSRLQSTSKSLAVQKILALRLAKNKTNLCRRDLS